MDAFHLFLGRPWQYDRKLVHDGFKNTYAFVRDGVKVILGTSKLGRTPKPSKGEERNLLSKYDFEELLECDNEACALVMLGKNEEKNEPPPIMQPLLSEYQDVTLK